MTEIADDFGMSSVAFAKHCKNANVPFPGRGYWQRIEHGHREKQTPLPKSSASEKIVIDRYEQRAALPRRPPGDIPRIEIAERIARHHPVAKELDALLQVDAHYQYMFAVGGHRHVTLKVGEITRKRALRVLHALFSAVEERGHQVRLSKPSERAEWTRAPRTLEFVVGDAAIEVSIREHLTQRAHEKTETEKKWAFMARKYDLEPSGDLVFEITVPWGTDTQTRWRENEKHRFEDFLGEILWAIDRAAETLVAHRAKVADDAKQAEIARKIAEDIERERKRKAADERQRREREARHAAHRKALHDDLVKMTTDWREADAVRAFLSAVDATMPNAARSEKFSAWFKWAGAQVLALDPLLRPEAIAKAIDPVE